MAKYEIPAKAEERMKAMNDQVLLFQEEYKEFKEKAKKSAGGRAKKALTIVKKLITSVRKDIQEEIIAVKKEAKKA